MGETSQATPSESWWSRFWRLLCDFEEAMDTSALDVLHRQINVLERKVAEIKANHFLHPAAGGGISPAK